MFEIRNSEREYAFLSDKDNKEKNRYGKNIQLIDENNPLKGQSLNINVELIQIIDMAYAAVDN